MKIIVGLGNPEEKYAGTKHNLGFDVLDEYVQKHTPAGRGIWTKEEKFKSEIIKLDNTLLVKPLTFMNNSGMAVRLLADYFKIGLEDLVIVHDELDLPLGKIKIRLGGAAAGHHGVESIIKSLQNDKFIRIRLGIGNLRSKLGEHGGEHFSADQFVLTPFHTRDKSKVKQMIKHSIKALQTLIDEGLEKVQNQYN